MALRPDHGLARVQPSWRPVALLIIVATHLLILWIIVILISVLSVLNIIWETTWSILLRMLILSGGWLEAATARLHLLETMHTDRILSVASGELGCSASLHHCWLQFITVLGHWLKCSIYILLHLQIGLIVEIILRRHLIAGHDVLLLIPIVHIHLSRQILACGVNVIRRVFGRQACSVGV